MSNKTHRRKVAIGVTLLLGLLCSPVAQGATVNFFLNISGGLFSDPAFNSALDAGSVIYVIATPNDYDPGGPPDPQSAGDALIADSTPSDDLLVATLFLNEASGPGTHFDTIGFTYDTADYPSGFSHIYLRFFDWDSAPPTGEDIAWGHSDAFEIPPPLPFGFPGTLTITNQYYTDRTDDFTVIPEPGTIHLILLAGGVLFGIWRRKKSF